MFWLGRAWPDLVIGFVIAAVAAKGGVAILRDASRSAKTANADVTAADATADDLGSQPRTTSAAAAYERRTGSHRKRLIGELRSDAELAVQYIVAAAEDGNPGVLRSFLVP